jgi:hypothetical protein
MEKRQISPKRFSPRAIRILDERALSFLRRRPIAQINVINIIKPNFGLFRCVFCFEGFGVEFRYGAPFLSSSLALLALTAKLNQFYKGFILCSALSCKELKVASRNPHPKRHSVLRKPYQLHNLRNDTQPCSSVISLLDMRSILHQFCTRVLLLALHQD